MAEIHLTAMGHKTPGGPDVPLPLNARLGNRPWHDPMLLLFIGADTVEIWPADPDRIRELSEQLARLADELEGG